MIAVVIKSETLETDTHKGKRVNAVYGLRDARGAPEAGRGEGKRFSLADPQKEPMLFLIP